METREYKDSGEMISLLGFGAMRLPKMEGSQKIDREKAGEMLDYAIAHGVNYIDTAMPYHDGDSERFLGEMLPKYPRLSYNIATKLSLMTIKVKTPKDVREIFKGQLKRLRVDYFDYYLAHNLNSITYPQFVELGAYEFLREKQREGIIRRIGFSYHGNVENLKEIISQYSWDFAQIQLNYLDWESRDAKQAYELLTANGIPVIVMEPIRGGSLAGLGGKAAGILNAANPNVSVASWALRFAASLPNVLTVLSGMSSIEQVHDNIKTMTDFRELSQMEYDTINRALEAYKLSLTVPCTGCRYCMDCNAGVDIPTIFDIYNQYKVDGNKWVFKMISNLLCDNAQASRCVECGRCEPLCPQHINIPGMLSKIDKEYRELTSES
ncbi:MAG: aldo/keto reductase [Oscillospiraceae bacterium]|nr:aldo/keto reductase [Oscillospiraceae bacterium]